MEKEDLIPLIDFCESHHIDSSFIRSLQQSGLIEVSTIQETPFLRQEQLLHIEKIIRFHYEMDINLEGIETINHLLDLIGGMQREITELKNKLQFYTLNEG